MPMLSSNISDYAWNIARDCDVDSICVFISDKTAPATRLYHLANYGVDEEILHRYQTRGICDSDPFTDILVHESPDDTPEFYAANDPRIARCGARSEDYWRFVGQENIDVVGASSLRLQSRLYLTIGVHRAPRRRAQGDVPVERLADRINTLQNRIAVNLLSSVLGNGLGGYKCLLSLLEPQHSEPVSDLPKLSRRETEIAHLICEGRQNKEIAWILSLSEYTVENHLRRVYRKFGIHNRAALVARMNGMQM